MQLGTLLCAPAVWPFGNLGYVIWIWHEQAFCAVLAQAVTSVWHESLAQVNCSMAMPLDLGRAVGLP
ncbi:MAG: hypothetical protein DCF17_01190 [Shackletoniella antarctica]|jgi:hypothetical protein|uniref:Uncharacterized protein n=1 Tax=Shackletoniella antarctica TaxID=268115 RepID=A0A2W4WMF2_9CYAN|nr:MAG: hypothetical protein DCF17_01190 [Shackletoniella antarctica]